MEWQAGYACGAYLMPRSVLTQSVSQFRRQRDVFDDIHPDSVQGTRLVELVSREFGVSKEAARVRLLKVKALTAMPSPSILDPQ
jgi:Zn-dependent peptidase ImmA (M78 family)